MYQHKIIENIDHLINQLDRRNKTIVFTNGCFDLLHKGHVHLLQEAKNTGDILIVAINSDKKIKKLKGETRPTESLEKRIKKVADLPFVDFVISFSEETPLLLIEKLKPTILVKGGDYSSENVIGSHLVKKVIIVPLLVGFSTTIQIERNK